ncbi:hypothetical protein EIP91_010452 [Steccherinum ochraceum]|uniref:Uncharacterized protein n=1 Tax=Steccherinum ochraceum TaxID=92696 RepID=A0A4R0R0K5_9APHY|nr:hypothetical protein EIP91_010452 [Steccherinum ochraceum]
MQSLRLQQPSLPLYHPLGRLAQSLPPLDPRIFGNPGGSVDVDDNDMQVDDSDTRRGPARTRKPAARLRDRDHEEGDDQAPMNGPSGVNGSVAETRPVTSPRKRRAAGTGGAGGTKRRRKETDDGTFPHPPRRTRNPRGVAVASPLAGVALAAVEAGDDEESPAPMDAPDLQTAILQAQEVRPVRSTRSRTQPKRRDSSASTSTSVSVSIAVHAQQVRTLEVVAEGAPTGDEDMADMAPPPKPIEVEPETDHVKQNGDSKVPQASTSGTADAISGSESKEATMKTAGAADKSSLADASSDIQPSAELSSATAGSAVLPPATTLMPRENPTIRQPEYEKRSVVQDQQKVVVEEEKEEGELSDGSVQ